MAIASKRLFNGKVVRVFNNSTSETFFKSSVGNVYYEDFMRTGELTFVDSAGTNLSGIVGQSGVWSPTVQATTSASPSAEDLQTANGIHRLELDTISETQRAYLNHSDVLSFDATNGLLWEARVRVIAGSLSGGKVVCGLTGTRNSNTLDNISQNIWFRYDANYTILCETDDGTSDTDDVDTGVTGVTNTWNIFRIEIYPTASSVREVRFYIDGSRVGSATTFDIAAYTDCVWQPHFELQNPTGAALAGRSSLDIDYCGMLWARNLA